MQNCRQHIWTSQRKIKKVKPAELTADGNHIIESQVDIIENNNMVEDTMSLKEGRYEETDNKTIRAGVQERNNRRKMKTSRKRINNVRYLSRNTRTIILNGFSRVYNFIFKRQQSFFFYLDIGRFRTSYEGYWTVEVQHFGII